jgi:hypothetical protein
MRRYQQRAEREDAPAEFMHAMQQMAQLNALRQLHSVLLGRFELLRHLSEAAQEWEGDEAPSIEELLIFRATQLSLQTSNAGPPPVEEGLLTDLEAVEISRQHIKDDRSTCTICQEAMPLGSRATALPCEHLYCMECIAEWLKRNRSCPICREEVTRDSVERHQRKPKPAEKGMTGPGPKPSPPKPTVSQRARDFSESDNSESDTDMRPMPAAASASRSTPRSERLRQTVTVQRSPRTTTLITTTRVNIDVAGSDDEGYAPQLPLRPTPTAARSAVAPPAPPRAQRSTAEDVHRERRTVASSATEQQQLRHSTILQARRARQ